MFFFLHSFLPRHHKNHPLMTEEDIATLVFEASVGIDHPISSPEQELQRLHEEMKDLKEDPDGPLTERLSHDWFRLNLRAAKAKGIKEEDIVFMFCESSKKKGKYGWLTFYNTCRRTRDSERMRELLDEFYGDFIPSHKTPAHSEQYCRAYHPAYRVLHSDYLKTFQQVLQELKGFTQIRIGYGSEDEALSAYPWVEGMVKCFYLYQDGMLYDQPEAVGSDLFQLLILNWIETIKYYNKDTLIMKNDPVCALQFLRRDGADIVLEQCSGIQGPVPDLQTQSRGSFFDSLCFILAFIMPLKPFQAICYHSRTGSDFVQTTRAEYDTVVIHFEQFPEEQAGGITADWVIAPECVSKK